MIIQHVFADPINIYTFITVNQFYCWGFIELLNCIFRTNQDSVPLEFDLWLRFLFVLTLQCAKDSLHLRLFKGHLLKNRFTESLVHLYFFLLLNVVAIIQDMYAHYCLINIWYIIFNRIVYNQRLSYSLLWEGFCTLVSTFVLVFHLVFHSVSINNMLIITSTGIQRKMKT